MRVLIVRNDKLGDFMLAWPTFALIKQYWPGVHISALVPAYTAPMARLCPWIDELLIDDPAEPATALARRMRAENFDAMLTLYSTGRAALAGWLARIPYRLAPATKAAQLLYNHRLTQRRSRSEKPEYAYNLDLGYRLLADFAHQPGPKQSTESLGDWLPRELPRPLLQFGDDAGMSKEGFCSAHDLPAEARLIFIHPGSGGSANNLSAAQYTELACALHSEKQLAFVITAGPGEEETAASIANGINAYRAISLQPQGGLAELARTLQLADLFISGSTGPLHIAGALDRPTAAFYPRHRSGSPLRWQTLNAPEKRLVFVPGAGAGEKEVASIDVTEAAQQINKHFLN